MLRVSDEGLLLGGRPYKQATNRDLLYAIRHWEILARQLANSHPKMSHVTGTLDTLIGEAQRRVGEGNNWRLLPADDLIGTG